VVKYRIAYCAAASAVVWYPLFDTGRPTRQPPTEDPVGQALQALLAEANPDMKPSLRKYIGAWHKMRGVTFLRLRQKKLAQVEIFRAIQHSGLTMRLSACAALTCLPGGLGDAMSRVGRRASRMMQSFDLPTFLRRS
jgi:hypothetical protein